MFLLDQTPKYKTPSETAIQGQKIELFPENSDPIGIFYGGRILQIVESLALQVAKNHADMQCVMRKIDFVRFHSPAKRGDVLVCSASVNCTWGCEIEVGISVTGDDFMTLEHKKILTAYFTFKAFDETLKPQNVPMLLPESAIEIQRYKKAQQRRELHDSKIS
ncbi:MAG TPA: hotdog domain-containing protein [Chlamydiales bacterium]|nr:hotdog domain-containing protein [Chlamydiales bacterium]